MAGSYDALADVHDWLVPDQLLTPEGSVAAFADVVDALGGGARVLDCAAGTGLLAVGLARRGFEVVAADASVAMVERTRSLAGRHHAELAAVACEWADLPARGWPESFDAVFCVGNSLPHAAGKAARRAALRAMAGVLREGGGARGDLAQLGTAARGRARRALVGDPRVDARRRLGRSAFPGHRGGAGGRRRRRPLSRHRPPRVTLTGAGACPRPAGGRPTWWAGRRPPARPRTAGR
ncbi:methyltransferase domain-containing protein [Actinoplanes nipponensis]|uniref:methyltransferase domain-containing protein n=1 Tax=Actinoplanes nipponensis TaxID=135950 RepID=UPI0019456D27